MHDLTTIHTPRLLLRRLQESDRPFILQMDTNKNVVGATRVRTTEQSDQFLAGQIDHWEKHGFGIWLAFDRDTLACAGRGGLRYEIIDGDRVVQVGYGLFPRFWGRGLATEIARASADAAFDVLGLTRLVAVALPNNIVSRKVLEKIGFSYARDTQYDGTRHVLYERLKSPAAAAGISSLPDLLT